MARIRFLLGAAAVTAFSAVPAQAQLSCTNAQPATSCSVTNTASVTIGGLVKLTQSAATTTLTPPSGSSLGSYVADAGPTFVVQANDAWTLSLKTTNTTNWTYDGGNSGAKPITDLTWSPTSGGPFVGITVGDVQLTSGSASNAGSAAVFYRTLYDASFAAAGNRKGVYSIPVVFTLAAP